MERIELRVDGMTCGGCETSVRNAVSRLPDVASVEADHVAGRVTVEVDGRADREAIGSAIEGAGFAVVG